MVDIRSSLVVSQNDDPSKRLNLTLDTKTLSSFVLGQKEMARLADEIVRAALVDRRFALRLSLFTRMHKAGYGFMMQPAGVFRSEPVIIEHSSLTPPPASDIVEFLDEMCDYVNDNWRFSSLHHLGAYVMWRFLWIHPFADGNGSIARLLSYMVMQIKAGSRIGAESRMFESISHNREEYYEVLSHADEQWRQGHLDLSRLESFLRKLLSEQLTGPADKITGFTSV